MTKTLAYIKEYFRTSSAHGLRYLADSKSVVEKALWGGLVMISFATTAFQIGHYLQDNDENPFVTTISTIPISEVPFPAVSLQPVQRFGNPWVNYATMVLDNLKFDCLKEDLDCVNATQLLRNDFRSNIKESLETVHLVLKAGYDLDMSQKRSSQQTCLTFSRILGKKVYDFLVPLIVLLENDDPVDLLDLSTTIFRLPPVPALQKACDFLNGKNETISTSFVDCYKALMDASTETQSTVYTFLIALGSKEPLQELGSFTYGENQRRRLFSIANAKFREIIDSLRKDLEYTSRLAEYLYNLQSSQVKEFDSISAQCLDIESYSQCQVALDSVCCKFLHESEKHFESILRVMKYTSRPSTRQLGEESFTRDITHALTSLQYEPLYDKSIGLPRQGMLPTIFSSIFQGQLLTEKINPKTECDFYNTYSWTGIVQSFNLPHFFDVFKNTTMTNAFFSQFYKKSDVCERWNQGHQPLKALSNGPHYGFDMILTIFGKIGTTISLHSPYDLPSLANNAININAGFTYTIMITPNKMAVDPSIAEWPIEKKKCAHENDIELALFKTYSQSRCFFECQLREAADICGCVPWNFPRLEPGRPICLTEGTTNCFATIMARVPKPFGAKCHCPPLCDVVHYTYHVDVAPTSTFQECYDKAQHTFSGNNGSWTRMGLDDKWTHGVLDFDLIDLSSTKELLEKDFPPRPCRYYLPKMALVKVYMGPSVVTVSTTSLKATFADKVAAIGGFMGLFTGMSLLSLFELLAFLLKFSKQLVTRR